MARRGCCGSEGPHTDVEAVSPPPSPSLEQKSSVVSRAAEQRRRCQSMKSYPSSELRNVCEEQRGGAEPGAEPAEEGVDMLQQMLDRR